MRQQAQKEENIEAIANTSSKEGIPPRVPGPRTNSSLEVLLAFTFLITSSPIMFPEYFIAEKPEIQPHLGIFVGGASGSEPVHFLQCMCGRRQVYDQHSVQIEPSGILSLGLISKAENDTRSGKNMIFRNSLPPPWLLNSATRDILISNSIYSLDLTAKLSILAVCKDWYQVGTEILYEDVHLHRIGQLPAFVRALEGHAGLGDLVTRIPPTRTLESCITVSEECTEASLSNEFYDGEDSGEIDRATVLEIFSRTIAGLN
ncbi:hypothetical protein B0H16DRAFT_1474947 [Mycena metata]|uniref:Uncharacterized protein n=1 Tax=Mycena metata TaxID=1033252 RepID=A0AAD7HGR7_9AGAR|nr:hypothetical protein B0H16DRAFT_1474947 [Mycena metata]